MSARAACEPSRRQRARPPSAVRALARGAARPATLACRLAHCAGNVILLIRHQQCERVPISALSPLRCARASGGAHGKQSTSCLGLQRPPRWGQDGELASVCVRVRERARRPLATNWPQKRPCKLERPSKPTAAQRARPTDKAPRGPSATWAQGAYSPRSPRPKLAGLPLEWSSPLANRSRVRLRDRSSELRLLACQFVCPPCCVFAPTCASVCLSVCVRARCRCCCRRRWCHSGRRVAISEREIRKRQRDSRSERRVKRVWWASSSGGQFELGA